MGAMTRQNYIDDVWYQLRMRTDLNPSDAAAKARIDGWVNRAYRWLCLPSVFRHPGMQKSGTITLVSGTTRYALPTDLFAIRFVINESKNDDRMDPRRPADLLESGGGDRTFARDGNDILIKASDGTDGDTVRIYYWARPLLLTNDAQRSEIEEYWDEAIVHKATGNAWLALGNTVMSDHYASIAAALVNEAREAGVLEAADDNWQNDLSYREPYQRTS